jgi:uncharacterized protein (DUF1800 family)
MTIGTDLALAAHLRRRAGFGATRDELERDVGLPYEALVDELLDAPAGPPRDLDLVERLFPASVGARGHQQAWPQWAWRIVATTSPLREKMALFWHGLFATGATKFPLHGLGQLAQIDTFRRSGIGNFETLLQQLARDPAMLFWLDNQMNLKNHPNENFGRELLELFTLGIGNYTEADVKAAARAFTGWHVRTIMPAYFLGTYPLEFYYDTDEHDDSEKTFLGETGRFDGDDVIAFFVSDTADPEAVQELARAFTDSGYEIHDVLRSLFLSDAFTSEHNRYRKVKGPVELVFGATRLTERWALPDESLPDLAWATHYQGQALLNPPSVEGWHEGEEWIDSCCLVERINFASAEIARAQTPGVQRMLARVAGCGATTGTEFVDACLDACGALAVSPETRTLLAGSHAAAAGTDFDADPEGSRARTLAMLQLIVATPDYQYC